MTDKQKKSIEHLTALDPYFASHSMDSILWAREYAVTTKISNLIANRVDLSKDIFDKIAIVFNEIENNEHFNGSGWHDYKIRLSGLFYSFGYNLKWDNADKLIVGFDNAK
jgi:hypothetical protein